MTGIRRAARRRPDVGIWLTIAGATWVLLLLFAYLAENAPASDEQGYRIVVPGLAADMCSATPDAPVWAAD